MKPIEEKRSTGHPWLEILFSGAILFAALRVFFLTLHQGPALVPGAEGDAFSSLFDRLPSWLAMHGMPIQPWTAATFAIFFGILTAWLLCQSGRSLLPAEQPWLAGTAAALFFLLNPAVLHQTPLPGLERSPWEALSIAAFLAIFASVSHWSIFMRSMINAVVLSVIFWISSPAAIWICVALLPWVIFSRRPLSSLSIFLTGAVLGLFAYGATGWLWLHFGWHLDDAWSALWRSPALAAKIVAAPPESVYEAGGHVAEGLSRVMFWISPFGFAFVVWSLAQLLPEVIRERRSQLAHIAAFLALVVLWSDFRSSGWPAATVAAVAPLIGYQIAQSTHLTSVPFRHTVLFVFLLIGVVLWNWSLSPWVILILAIAGRGMVRLFRIDRSLSNSEGWRAALVGGWLAWIVVVNVVLQVRH